MIQDNNSKKGLGQTERENTQNAHLNANASTRTHARDSVTPDFDLNKYAKQMQTAMNQIADQTVKTEAHLERIFCREVKDAGGMALKFNPIGQAGLPDRIVFYMGFAWLVEMKTPKGRIQPVQLAMHRRFAEKGFKVRIIRTKEQIAAFVDDMLNLVL